MLTVDDAIAELEDEGYELDALGDVGPLLGRTAVGFDFTVGDSEPWLWFPRDHEFSPGFGVTSDEGSWEGTVYLAQLDDGVLIVTAGGEIGTDDVDLVRPLFDDIVRTLAAAD